MPEQVLQGKQDSQGNVGARPKGARWVAAAGSLATMLPRRAFRECRPLSGNCWPHKSLLDSGQPIRYGGGMETQNQVRQSLLDDFTRLQGLLANEVFARRSEAACAKRSSFGTGVVACSEQAA